MSILKPILTIALAFAFFAAPETSTASESQSQCHSIFQAPVLYRQRWADTVPRHAPSAPSVFKTFGLLIMREAEVIKRHRADKKAVREHEAKLEALEIAREEARQFIYQTRAESPELMQLASDTEFKVSVSRSQEEIAVVQAYFVEMVHIITAREDSNL